MAVGACRGVRVSGTKIPVFCILYRMRRTTQGDFTNARNFAGLQCSPNTEYKHLCVPSPAGLLDFAAAANSGCVSHPPLSIPSIMNSSALPSSINHDPSGHPPAIHHLVCNPTYSVPAPESSSPTRDAALLPRRLVKRQEPIVQGLESLDRQNAPPHTKSRPSSSGQPQTSKTKSSRLHRCIGSTAIIARPSCARLTWQLISARHFPLPVLARSTRDVIGARHAVDSISCPSLTWPSPGPTPPCRTSSANRRPRTVRASPLQAPALPTTPRQNHDNDSNDRDDYAFPSSIRVRQPHSDSSRHVEQSSQGAHR